MNSVWNYIIFNNRVETWLIVLSIMLASTVFLRFLQLIVLKKLQAVTSRTKSSFDDFFVGIIRRFVMPALYLISIHFSLQYLNFSTSVFSVEHVVIMVIITFFIIKIIAAFLRYSFHQSLLKGEQNAQREKQAKGILLIVQGVMWMGGLLFLIDNLGYDITTLIAGLGIGGIAIALAAQTILGDLFSYLVIFFDKPFEIGDFIIMDDKMGTVEYIGIKTTRIRTLGGEQLICSNTDLTNSRVHNYKRMQERRVVFSFGIVYGIPGAKLKIIPRLVKNIIDKIELARFDRAHFKSFGDSSLDFEVVFYVLSPDYNVYMDIQQSINVSLFELFEKEHIDFAFPTQTVYLTKLAQEQMARA